VALSDRIPYQAQVDRPKLTLPGGKKLAVWVILNVEEWRIENAMPRTVLSPPMGRSAAVAGRAELVMAIKIADLPQDREISGELWRSTYEDALPSPAINLPKPPRANSRGSCRL
jgi:hypothetical protein